jgi:nuclear hormone receptor FTZ-F1
MNGKKINDNVAVRADRMRGGRNKFGPMYKRDRARRLQLLRQRQMVRGQVPSLSNNGAGGSYSPGEVGGSSSFLVATINNVGNLGAQAIYSADGIKQELIQIPQLSSSTSSPDSSPSSGQPNLTPGSHSNASQYQASSSSAPGAAGGHPSGHSLATGGPVNHPEMIKWASVSNPNGCPSGNGLVKPNSSGLGFHYGDNRQAGPLLGTSSGVLGLGPLSSSGQGNGKIPLIVRELQQTAPDDKEWQSQLFGLLNNQTYNQCEVDLFELMCKVIDQSLFAQVDWARNSIFFKDLKVSFIIIIIIQSRLQLHQLSISILLSPLSKCFKFLYNIFFNHLIYYLLSYACLLNFSFFGLTLFRLNSSFLFSLLSSTLFLSHF